MVLLLSDQGRFGLEMRLGVWQSSQQDKCNGSKLRVVEQVGRLNEERLNDERQEMGGEWRLVNERVLFGWSRSVERSRTKHAIGTAGIWERSRRLACGALPFDHLRPSSSPTYVLQ